MIISINELINLENSVVNICLYKNFIWKIFDKLICYKANFMHEHVEYINHPYQASNVCNLFTLKSGM